MITDKENPAVLLIKILDKIREAREEIEELKNALKHKQYSRKSKYKRNLKYK